MTRFVGPAADSRNAFGYGRTLLGHAAVLYTDLACTTPADILAYDPAAPTTLGAAVTESKVLLDDQGRLPKVWFPDEVTQLYARLIRGASKPVAVTATRPGVLKAFRSASGDTTDLAALYDELSGLLFRVDARGRIRTHGLAAGQVPTVAIGAGIGSSGNGAAAVLSNAADLAGTIAITTASTGTAAGVLATITLTAAFAANAKVVFFPKDAAAAALQPYATTTTTTVALRTAATPAAATTYTFDYVIIG